MRRHLYPPLFDVFNEVRLMYPFAMLQEEICFSESNPHIVESLRAEPVSYWSILSKDACCVGFKTLCSIIVGCCNSNKSTSIRRRSKFCAMKWQFFIFYVTKSYPSVRSLKGKSTATDHGGNLSGRWIRRELVLASTKGQFIRQNAKNENKSLRLNSLIQRFKAYNEVSPTH